MSSNVNVLNMSPNGARRLALIESFVAQNFDLQGKGYPEPSQMRSMAKTWEEFFLHLIPDEHLQSSWKAAVRNHGSFQFPVNPREIFDEWKFLRAKIEQAHRLEVEPNAEFATSNEVHELFEQARQLIRRF